MYSKMAQALKVFIIFEVRSNPGESFLGCKELYCSLSLFIASSWRINISLKRNFIHFPKVKHIVPKSNERETKEKAKSPPNLAIKDVLQGCGEEIYCSGLIVVFVEAELIWRLGSTE